MNKKTILLLTIIFITSAIAYKVLAGPACGSGTCGIVATPATATSTAGSTNVLNLASGTWSAWNVTANATCSNSSGVQCWQLNNTAWANCNDTTSVNLGQTTELNASTWTNNSVSVSAVYVKTGSVVAAARISPQTVATVSTTPHSITARDYIGPASAVFSDSPHTVLNIQSDRFVISRPGIFKSNTLGLCLETTDGTGGKLDDLCLNYDGITATTATVTGMAWDSTNNRILVLLTRNLYVYGSEYTVIISIPINPTTGQIQVTAGDPTSIYSYNTGDGSALYDIVNVPGKPTKFLAVGYVTSLYRSLAVIVLTTDNVQAFSGIYEYAQPLTDDYLLTSVTPYAAGIDGKYRFWASGFGSASGMYYPIYSEILMDKVTDALTIKQDTMILTSNIIGTTRITTDPKPGYVYISYQTANNIYTATIDSTGTVKAVATSSAQVSGLVTSAPPNNFGAGFSSSGVFSTPTTTGSKVIVTSGLTIIDAFDVNFTVDSGAKVTGINTGGHVGDYSTYVLAGRSLDNHTIILDFFTTNLTKFAINPNGTMTFSTLKQVAIQTLHPDINILNFRLTWQNFTGNFDTSAGTCTGCVFDLDNGTCQAEVERVFGMYNSYNVTINLTSNKQLNFTTLNMLCRDGNATVAAHPNCTNLFSSNPTGITTGPCMTWANSTNINFSGGSTNATTFPGGLAIDISQLNGSIDFNMGTLVPTQTCDMIACEINGTWKAGNTQDFVLNKTITVTAR